MSILKKVLERRQQLDEVSKGLLTRYGAKAVHSQRALSHEADRESNKGHGYSQYHDGFKTKPDRKAAERGIELGAKANQRQHYIKKAATKVNPGAAAKLKDSPNGRVDANLKYMTKFTKERYFREEAEELEEGGNAANKVKKNLHMVKQGMKTHPMGDSGSEYAALHPKGLKGVANEFKKEGRMTAKHGRPNADVRFHPKYQSKTGTYHIIDTHNNDAVVDHHVANSGGAAMSIADRWNKKHNSKSFGEETAEYSLMLRLVEDAYKRRGRPKKKRNLAGEIIEDEPKS